MIEQNVQLVRCDDERLWVRLGSQSGCTACDNGKGCGAGLFTKLLRGKPVVLELARNDIRAEPGQMLVLSFPEQVYIQLILAYYGWPLLAALVGAIAGHGLCTSLLFGTALVDLGTLLMGVSAGGLAMRFTSQQDKVETVLNSLHMALYYPSTTPNICTGTVEEPEHF